MMSNSESRKREAERAAGVLVADVDTLAGVIRNNALPPRELAEALVAAGFGRIDAARREIAGAERRIREQIANDIRTEAGSYCEGCDSCDGNTQLGLMVAAVIAERGVPS